MKVKQILLIKFKVKPYFYFKSWSKQSINIQNLHIKHQYGIHKIPIMIDKFTQNQNKLKQTTKCQYLIKSEHSKTLISKILTSHIKLYQSLYWAINNATIWWWMFIITQN